jgi:hypothetical protein
MLAFTDRLKDLREVIKARPVDAVVRKVLHMGSLSHAGITVHQLLTRLAETIAGCAKASEGQKEEVVRLSAPPHPRRVLCSHTLCIGLLDTHLWTVPGPVPSHGVHAWVPTCDSLPYSLPRVYPPDPCPLSVQFAFLQRMIQVYGLKIFRCIIESFEASGEPLYMGASLEHATVSV